MSRLVAALVILGLCSASLASEEACQNFINNSKFDSSVLDGAWTLVYYWPFNTSSKKIVVQYRALSAEQVTAYKNEISSTYPAISWEKVKYSMSTQDDRKNKEYIFLLDIEDDTGYVKAIPAGELFQEFKSSGQPAVTVNYAYKQVGEYLAVKWCDESREDGYLMHKGTEQYAADVERVASGIANAISSKHGGLAVFLQPERIV